MKDLVLVDDSPDQIELMLLALRSIGIRRTVATFPSGEECLCAIERGTVSPGLILMDVNMPGLDGPATVRRARALLGRGAAIVLMSTSDRADDVRCGLDAGADSYVLKPRASRTWSEVLSAVTGYWLACDLRTRQ